MGVPLEDRLFFTKKYGLDVLVDLTQDLIYTFKISDRVFSGIWYLFLLCHHRSIKRFHRQRRTNDTEDRQTWRRRWLPTSNCPWQLHLARVLHISTNQLAVLYRHSYRSSTSMPMSHGSPHNFSSATTGWSTIPLTTISFDGLTPATPSLVCHPLLHRYPAQPPIRISCYPAVYMQCSTKNALRTRYWVAGSNTRTSARSSAS